MQPSKYGRDPWSYKGPPEKRQRIPTGGMIRHKDGTIERYDGNVPSRYSRKGVAGTDTETTHAGMSLGRSAAASTCEWSKRSLGLTMLAAPPVTQSASWSTPTLVNGDERGGLVTESGTATSEKMGDGKRQPSKQLETTAKGSSRGVGSMFSKARSLLGDK